MIILPILTTTLIQFSSKGWKNVLFWETAFWHKNLLLLITRNNLVEYHTIQLLHLILRCSSRVHLIFSPFRIRYLTSLRGHRKKKRVREIGKNDCPIPLFIRKCTYITVFHITSHNTARHDITPNISITYTDRKKSREINDQDHITRRNSACLPRATWPVLTLCLAFRLLVHFTLDSCRGKAQLLQWIAPIRMRRRKVSMFCLFYSWDSTFIKSFIKELRQWQKRQQQQQQQPVQQQRS